MGKKRVKVMAHWSNDKKYIRNLLEFDRSMAKQIKTFEAVQAMKKIGEGQ